MSSLQYEIKKSNRPNKKYMAIFKNGSVVHFGDSRYQQYEDKTPLKIYSHMDHKDETRKLLYYTRHGRNYKKYSPGWFSAVYLW